MAFDSLISTNLLSVLSVNIISNPITEAPALFRFSITLMYFDLLNGNLQSSFKVFSSIFKTTICLVTFGFIT
jgi:hypothetical protein